MNENITYQITVTGGHEINQFTTSSPPHHLEDVCRRARENESGKATEHANCGVDVVAEIVYGLASR